MKKRELELLKNICKENDVPLKLAQELIRTSKKFSYENVSKSTRTNEYQHLIDYHNKYNE